MLVLLHGNGLDRRSFRSILEADAFAHLTRVVIELPGHGASVRHADPAAYALPSIAAAVTERIAELEAGRVVLAGHSLGGHVAFEAAPAIGPELVGVFVWGTPPLSCAADAAGAFHALPELGNLWVPELTPDDAEALAQTMYVGDAPDWVGRSILATDGQMRAGLGASLAEDRLADEVAMLDTLSCPVALVHAERDALVRRDYLEALSGRCLWRGGVQLVPTGSHCCHEEQPEAFLPVLDAFVADCLPARGAQP